MMERKAPDILKNRNAGIGPYTTYGEYPGILFVTIESLQDTLPEYRLIWHGFRVGISWPGMSYCYQ